MIIPNKILHELSRRNFIMILHEHNQFLED